MAFCSECGAEYTVGHRFCGACGKPLPTPFRLIEGAVSHPKASTGSPQPVDKSGVRKRAEKAQRSKRPERAERDDDGAFGEVIGQRLGEKLAETILPGNELAKNVGMSLGRRLAERLMEGPLITFGSDPASVAFAMAGKKSKRKKKRARKSKVKGKGTALVCTKPKGPEEDGS